MSVRGSTVEWREEAQALERFALALAADTRFTRDRAAAALLAESLINRSVLALHNGEGPRELGRHSRLLCLFVRFHRRHLRLRSLEEEGAENGGLRDAALLERVIAAMPLEWREALLLVVIERLSHGEAAAVLEIPLTALVDRLVRARAALSQALASPIKATPERRRGAPHLRLIK
jgi:DNA-directed RNA polymerase specialized sigma24 family protein